MVFLNIRAAKGMAALCASQPFPALADVQSVGRIPRQKEWFHAVVQDT